MAQRFPQVNYSQIAKVAKQLGFSFLRQGKGSHEVWRNNKGRYTTIPKHGSKTIKRKTLKSIFNDLQITSQDFFKIR